jgi:hypothetical protein
VRIRSIAREATGAAAGRLITGLKTAGAPAWVRQDHQLSEAAEPFRPLRRRW